MTNAENQARWRERHPDLARLYQQTKRRKMTLARIKAGDPPLTPSERGIKSGTACYEKHGTPFYQRIGAMGGRARGTT